MNSVLLKGKDFAVRHKIFFLLWLLVSIKFYYETSGSVAGFFTVKFTVCAFFYCAFALLLYFCYRCFEEKKEPALIFCSLALFAYYCCMNRSFVYTMQIENYTAAALLIFSIVFSLKRQTLFFAVPLCLAALLVSPGTTAAMIPVPLCIAFLNTGVSDKNEKTEKSGKVRNDKKGKTVPEKLLEKTASIPPAVTVIPLVLFFVLSFVLYRRRNPYGAVFSIETSGVFLKNSIKVLLFFSPFIIFALVIWICILKARRSALKDFICTVITSLTAYAAAYVIPDSVFSPEAYLSVVLLCSLSVTAFRISRDKASTETVAAFVSKYSLALALIAVATAGIFLKYYQ